MAFFLLVPILLAWLITRRLLGERDLLDALSLVLPLGTSLLLFGVNALYRFTSLEQAILATLALMIAAAGLIAWRCPAQPLCRTRLHPGTQVFLLLALMVLYLFANSQQSADIDDDYWIHTPLQGLMRSGNFPPTNPFFPEIPMNGHYGRNLILVTVGWLSGWDVLSVQFAATDVIQMATFMLFFTTLRRGAGSDLQACLGAGFIAFGINVGGRGGLMDTMQNNNPVVHLVLALTFNLILRTWEGNLPAALLAGLSLGGYAIVYETHFGLVVLALVSTTTFLLAAPTRPGKPPGLRRQELLRTLLVLAVAFPLAMTQGGPLTRLAQSLGQAQGQVDVSALSKGMQNQSQVLTLKFPKERLFQIFLEEGDYRRVSYVYQTPTFLRHFYRPSKGQGYHPIWSWEVLRMHWLPLFLMPASLLLLLHRRHRIGLLLATFGSISFLVPALVDFGPIYESEYFRWQFAAGLGLAGALGIAAGCLFEDLARLRPGASLRNLAFVALGVLVWLETLTCWELVRQRACYLSSQGIWLRGAIRLPETRDWLARHPLLDFHPSDWEMAEWLRAQVQPGQRMLSDFDDSSPIGILRESTMSGLSGIKSVGHALPLDEEAIGTPPFHMAPPARAFWATLDPDLLRGLRLDWIYSRAAPGTSALHDSLRGVPGLSLVRRFHDPHGGNRFLYRVESPHLHAGPTSPERSALEVVSLETTGCPGARGVHRIRLGVRNSSPTPLVLRDGVFFYEAIRRQTMKRTAEVERILQPVDLHLDPGGTRILDLVFVESLEPGDFDLEFFSGDAHQVRLVRGVATGRSGRAFTLRAPG